MFLLPPTRALRHAAPMQRERLPTSTAQPPMPARMTVAAAGKPPRRIAFPQRQKQRFVQPGRLAPTPPPTRNKPRPHNPPPEHAPPRKLPDQQQTAKEQPSTSGRSPQPVRSKRQRVPAASRGFGDPLTAPGNARDWQARRDWLVMSMEQSLLDDDTFDELKRSLDLEETARPQVSLLYALGMRERELVRLLDSRRYVLELGVPTLQNKLRFLRNEVGLADPDIVRLLTKFPRILEYRSEKTIARHIDFFLQAGVEQSDIPKIVMRAPMILELSISNTLQPRLDFLTTHAHVPTESLGKLIGRHPLVLTCTEEGMRGRVDFLTNEVGMPPEDSGRAVLAHPQVLQYSVSAMRARVAYMRSVGMSVEQAAAVFARLPQLFGLDVNNNLAPKIRYLVHELGGSVTTLSNYPAYLSLSLTNRIIPRHRFLEAHQKSVPRPFPMSYLKCSDEKFAQDVAGSSLQRFELFRHKLASVAAVKG